MYKECDVVMLTAKEKAGLVINPTGNKIQYSSFVKSAKYYTDAGFKCCHLYVLSDEEIKEGDWCYYKGHLVKACNKSFNDGTWKKIIVTTDESLAVSKPFETKDMGTLGNSLIPLPKPPQSFISLYIEEYNKGNMITKIMVEYESKPIYVNNGSMAPIDYQLKIHSDHTINVKLVKESWSREEVIAFANKAIYDYIGSNSVNIKVNLRLEERWIEQNL